MVPAQSAYVYNNKLLTKYSGTDGVSGLRRDLHMMYLLDKGFKNNAHLKQLPLDKTTILTYARLMGVDTTPVVQVAFFMDKNQVEEDSPIPMKLIPMKKNWAVQLGAYRNIKVAKSVAKRTKFSRR